MSLMLTMFFRHNLEHLSLIDFISRKDIETKRFRCCSFVYIDACRLSISINVLVFFKEIRVRVSSISYKILISIVLNILYDN